MIFLTPAFFIAALLYASVGFAGGSTYTALLVLVGTDAKILPIISLACNLIVAGGGSLNFARKGLVPWRRMCLILAVSMPAAWIGGSLPVSKPVFVALLGGSLLVAGLLLLLQPMSGEGEAETRASPLLAPLIAAPIGLLSGIVGIGGGIFLAPILHLMGWDKAKRVAAAASVFILANSLAGLGGQLTKITPAAATQATSYWPLAIAVLVGGQLGSRVAINWFTPRTLRRATAILILYVAVQLLWQRFGH